MLLALLHIPSSSLSSVSLCTPQESVHWAEPDHGRMVGYLAWHHCARVNHRPRLIETAQIKPHQPVPEKTREGHNLIEWYGYFATSKFACFVWNYISCIGCRWRVSSSVAHKWMVGWCGVMTRDNLDPIKNPTSSKWKFHFYSTELHVFGSQGLLCYTIIIVPLRTYNADDDHMLAIWGTSTNEQ